MKRLTLIFLISVHILFKVCSCETTKNYFINGTNQIKERTSVKNTWLINQLKIVKKFNSVIGHLGTLKQKIANEFASRLLLRKIFGKFNSYWQKAAEIKITYVDNFFLER